MLTDKGILLVAFGHPYYGRMAYNFAVSVKAVEPDFPIAVAVTDTVLNHISERQQRVFDRIIKITPDTPIGFVTKLYLDQITPFEKTLFCDVDTLWLPTSKGPSEVFRQLDGHHFSAITEGRYNIETHEDQKGPYYYWADPKEIIATYGITSGYIYQWRSEVIYFDNSETTKNLFNIAREVYSNSEKLKSRMAFARTVPDELAFNIAAAVLGIDPHEYKWMPAYWPALNGNALPPLQALTDGGKFLMSFGGHSVEGGVKRMYNKIMTVACRKFGVQHLFVLFAKTQFAPERRKQF